MRRLRSVALVSGALIGVACSESPTAPTQLKVSPSQPENSVITPLLLPRGAAWGLYFVSFNRDRNLTLDAIHYKTGVTRGQGSFLIPGVGAGALYVARAYAYGGCTPEGLGTPCDPNNNVGVPESARVFGIAFLARGGRVPFKVDLHSNFWPNPTNTYDTADLYFCDPTYTACSFVSHFYGELHHEPQ